MATSSFKSSSKAPSTSSSTSATSINKQSLQHQQQSRKPQDSTQKTLPRRSRSVSAFPSTQLNTTSEFQNKRDNPLFSVDGSPNNSEEDNDMVKLSNFEIPKIVGVNNLHSLKGDFNGGGDSRRGRSVLRNSGSEPKFSDGGSCDGGRKGIGRSLSRVDTGRRRRSLSRGHYGNSECEREQVIKPLNSRSRSKISSKANNAILDKTSNLARSASDFSELLKGRNTWSSQHPASVTSDDSPINLSGSLIPHWDDEKSTSSISEAEEKTINAVSEKITPLKDNSGVTGEILETVRSEVRRAISNLQSDLKHVRLKGDSDVIDCSINSDVTYELEDPNAVELVEDFREEFARELEECEERTRKLRAELAVEEHRENELNKILNDTVPEPKTPVVQKTRTLKKASFERKKVSRHLEEDALAFFDECVSISTFDESDFSSMEDLPSLVSVDGPGSERVGLPGVPSRFSDAYSYESQRTPLVQCHEGSPLERSLNNCSLSKSPSISLEEDIRNHVKSFCKDSGGETSNSDNIRTSSRKIKDYKCKVPVEKLLLDRVTFRSNIESGGMLFCGGGAGLSVALFSSVLR